MYKNAYISVRVFSKVSLIQRLITSAMINIFPWLFFQGLQKEILEILMDSDFLVRPPKFFGLILTFDHTKMISSSRQIE